MRPKASSVASSNSSISASESDSIDGEPATVGLWTDSEYVSVIMAAQRTRLEYALGAAVDIALARNFGGKIEDDRGFFGPPGEVSTKEMLERLRLQPDSETCDLRALAERLRIGDRLTS